MSVHMPPRWTPEDDALLLKLWDEGVNAPDIGRRLGRTVAAVVERRGMLRRREKGKSRAGQPAPRWTPEEDAELERAWAECGTLESVTARLPGRPANGVHYRATVVKGWPSKPRGVVKSRACEHISPRREEAARAPVQAADVKVRPCLWPMGDPREPGFHFCHAPSEPGRPYCPDHCAVAYKRVGLKRDGADDNQASPEAA